MIFFLLMLDRCVLFHLFSTNTSTITECLINAPLVKWMKTFPLVLYRTLVISWNLIEISLFLWIEDIRSYIN